MRVAIIGLPQSGKSTVFQSLTGMHTVSTHGEEQKIQIGNVKVPDARLDRVAALFKPPKIIRADMDFMDISGGHADRKGTGLTVQTISEIRIADALIATVCAFDNPAVIHPFNSIDPLRDTKTIQAELCVNDMIQVEKRLKTIEKERVDPAEREAIIRAKEWLDEERPLRLLDLNDTENRLLAGFGFLSQKSLLLVVNIQEDDIGKPPDERLVSYSEETGLHMFHYSAEVELEISELPPEDQKGFLLEMGLEVSGKERLVREVYKMLKLISFFTVVETEIRAWSVPKGTHAVNAAGKIHSDMERGFIRAEVIDSEELIRLGSLQAAREGGYLRLEGKDYEIRDGELVKFRFNV